MVKRGKNDNGGVDSLKCAQSLYMEDLEEI